MADEIQLCELRATFPDIAVLSEGGKEYIVFPNLRVAFGGKDHAVKGLLCPSEHSGYPTKLFLSEKIPAALNWNFCGRILDSTWYSWSWKDVHASLRLIQILASHLAAFR